MNQLEMENYCSYTAAMAMVREYIENQNFIDAMLRLHEWAIKDHYASKQEQLLKMLRMDLLEETALRILVSVAARKTISMNTVIGMVSPWLEAKLDDHEPRTMKRVGEIATILAEADLLDLELHHVPNKVQEDLTEEELFYVGTHEELWLTWPKTLPVEVSTQLKSVGYVPCMLEAPRVVKHMHDSPYLIHQAESLVNSNAEPNININPDALNLVAGIRFRLATDFISQIEPVGSDEFQLECTAAVVDFLGDREFFLPAFNDTRGRQYARGWQINYQGDDYHKSMISFADEQPI